MKIFKMNDCDYCAAETKEDALQALADCIGDGQVTPQFIEEYDCHDVRELTDEEYDRLKMIDEDDYYRAVEDPDEDETYEERRKKYMESCPTFRQTLDKMVADGEKFPCHFASSEW